MKMLKKIGLIVAMICMIIIKIPVTIAVFLLTNIESMFMMAGRWLVKELGDKYVIYGYNAGLDFNIDNCNSNEEFFIDMKIES